jgi:hypothetical protein
MMGAMERAVSGLAVAVAAGVIVFFITNPFSDRPVAPTVVSGGAQEQVGSGASGQIGPNSVPIQLTAACEWAYPGQASGNTSGSGYNVVCLDADGQTLGGFPDSSDHSLNDWCADSHHTDGMDLRQAELTPNGWACAHVQ